MTDETFDRLIRGLRGGDERIIREFYSQFGALMQTLAEKHISSSLRRRIGPEDVVQSACRTFLRRAKIGEFDVDDGDDLWRLLCTITLTKAREQARFHSRMRRGVKQEVSIGEDEGGPAAILPTSAPSPLEVAEFDDQFRQLTAAFTDEERQLVALKLESLTNPQIAEKLGCSERTVRRLLDQLRTRLARFFDHDAAR
jgi:RNA polymerase sigma factor (sigma-70 family)